MDRYSRNKEMISKEDNRELLTKHVTVVGAGGIGGYVIEMCSRIGIGTIHIIDPDFFEVSNLNRQLYSNEDVLGRAKTEIACKRVRDINSHINCTYTNLSLDYRNGETLCEGTDIIIDAVDFIASKFDIQKVAEALQIPFIHGSIGGWYGQVCTIFPGENTLNRIYENNQETGFEKTLDNPSFTPGIVAAIQVSEAVKVLLNKGDSLNNRVLRIDLSTQEYEVIELN